MAENVGAPANYAPVSHVHGRAPFVGRSEQIDFLKGQFAAVASGQGGRLVLIGGDPGVGKTRLAREVGQLIQAQGGRYLEGHYLRDGGPPNGPWVDVLRHGLHAVERDVVARWAGDYGPELTHFLPELAERLGSFPPPPRLALLDQRRRIFDGIVSLISYLAQQAPLVVHLDDLQWAPEMDLLQYLIRRCEGVRALILGTYREQEFLEQLVLRRGWHELNRGRLATELHLRPLTEPETAELIGHYFGAAVAGQVRTAVYRQTRGNVFFTEEVLRSLSEVGAVRAGAGDWEVVAATPIVIPESMKLTIEERVARHGDLVREVLVQAAVLGQEFSVPALRTMTGRTDDELVSALDRAALARLIVDRSRAGEERFAFSDDQLQEVLYQGIPPLRRHRYHLRAGEALEEVYADRLDSHLDELTRHFGAGQHAPKLADYALRAAERNTRLFQWPRALADYDQALTALAHLPNTDDNCRRRIDATLAAVNLALFANSPDVNRERLLAAADLATSLPGSDGRAGGDAFRLGRIWLLLGRVHVTRSEYRAATEAYRRALSEADRAADAEVRALAASGLGRVLVWQGRFAAAQPLLRQADEALPKGTGGLWIGNLGFLGAALVADGDYAAGVAAGLQAHAAALAANDWPALTVSHVGLTLIHFLGGEASQLLAASQALMDAADKSGDHLLRFLGQVFRGWAIARLGDSDPALTSFEQARASQQAGSFGLADWLSAAIAEVTLATGRTEDALAQAEEALRVAQSVDNLFTAGIAHRVKALAHLRHRELGSARLSGHTEPSRTTARGKRRHDDERLAAAADAAEAHLAASVECFDSGGARLEAAHTRVIWGRLRADRHDLPAALDQFAQAATRFQAAGLAADLAATRHLIENIQTQRSRGTPRVPSVPAGLSPRELEVLRHVVAGRTNREIAAELVVGVSTVDRHIYNIYAKIGARGRADARTRLPLP